MGKVNSFVLLFLFCIYLIMIVYSLILVFRREKKLNLLFFVLLVLVVPFVGPISYIIFYHAKNENRLENIKEKI